MKIILDKTTLARGSEHRESPSNLKLSTNRLLQIAPTVRGPTALLFDRSNWQLTLAFQLTRTHTSQAEAQAFALEHALEIRSLKGTLTLIPDDHPNEAAFQMKDALVRSLHIEPLGLQTIASYEILSSSIKSTTTSNL